jgi:hypothetical protein
MDLRMKKALLAVSLMLSGCTASFQPFPAGVSAKELSAVLQKIEKNDRDLAKGLADMTIALDERLKKLEPKK